MSSGLCVLWKEVNSKALEFACKVRGLNSTMKWPGSCYNLYKVYSVVRKTELCRNNFSARVYWKQDHCCWDNKEITKRFNSCIYVIIAIISEIHACRPSCILSLMQLHFIQLLFAKTLEMSQFSSLHLKWYFRSVQNSAYLQLHEYFIWVLYYSSCQLYPQPYPVPCQPLIVSCCLSGAVQHFNHCVDFR